MATIATPTDQLEPLRFFVGTWRCGGTKVQFKATFTREGGDRFTLRPMLRPGDDWIAVAELAFSRS